MDLPPICDDYSENYELMLKVSYLCNLRTIQEGYVNQMFDENLKGVFMDIKNSNALYIAWTTPYGVFFFFGEITKRLILAKLIIVSCYQ